MTRMTTRVMLLLVLFLPICAWGVQTQEQKKPPPVSSSLPPLPPPPEVGPVPDVPPQPPPPLGGYPKHYEFVMPVGPALQGVSQDFQLPPGQITVKWVAVGSAQSDVSNGVEVTVLSSSLYFRTSPSGTSEMFIGSPGANMRAIARRKNYTGGFSVKVSIDLGQPQ
jgi:hypothetical protein